MKISLISNENNRENKRFYVCDKVGAKDKELINILRQEIPFKIILYTYFPGFCSEIELAKDLEVHPSTIHFHIKKLLGIGILKPAEAKDGGFISSLKRNPIVIKKQNGREIFYTWKDNETMKDVDRILITHKDSMSDPNIINEYKDLMDICNKLFKYRNQKKYFAFNSALDNIINEIEEIFSCPFCC